jgi:hypothetical protein
MLFLQSNLPQETTPCGLVSRTGLAVVLLLVHAADGAPEQNPVSFVKELQANRSPLCREVSANRAAWEREIQLRLRRMHEEAAALSGLEITGRPAETLKLEVPPAGLPETAIKRRAPGTSGRRAA